MAWYSISNIHEIDSPALVVWPDRIKENMRILKNFIPDSNRIRPHVKTNKCAEVCRLMMDAGIRKFKCATIAEGEMLAMLNAPDVLLAYQPIGPRGLRLCRLIKKYPATPFSCLVDNEATANELSATALQAAVGINVFLDLNVGMNRTGVIPENALSLFQLCQTLEGINPVGLHAYDGHHRDASLETRTKGSDEGFARVEALQSKILEHTGKSTLSIHAKRKNAECSPGTFIFWDYGYHKLFSEQPFVFAALLVARIISKPDEQTVCIDLGHKAVASENPLNSRVHFLNAPELEPIGHSEEHLIVKAPEHNQYKVGDVLYGVPFHICPTVALHEFANVVVDGIAIGHWMIDARKREITI